MIAITTSSSTSVNAALVRCVKRMAGLYLAGGAGASILPIVGANFKPILATVRDAGNCGYSGPHVSQVPIVGCVFSTRVANRLTKNRVAAAPQTHLRRTGRGRRRAER